MLRMNLVRTGSGLRVKKSRPWLISPDVNWVEIYQFLHMVIIRSGDTPCARYISAIRFPHCAPPRYQDFTKSGRWLEIVVRFLFGLDRQKRNPHMGKDMLCHIYQLHIRASGKKSSDLETRSALTVGFLLIL